MEVLPFRVGTPSGDCFIPVASIGLPLFYRTFIVGSQDKLYYEAVRAIYPELNKGEQK